MSGAFTLFIAALLVVRKSMALSFVTPEKPTSSARRAVICAPVQIWALCLPTHPSNAFDNAVPDYTKYADKPKRRGTAPKDIGVLPRTTEGEYDEVTQPGLRTCDGNPNCFSTTGDFRLEDRQQYGIDFFIQPWKPPANDPTPLVTLSKVVKDYEPGQGGIDGGGFSVVKETPSYLYYQFESLKKGYIDDLEFSFSPNGILVRSASRVGFTDFGVNAVRLNYLAKELRKKGWIVADITPDSHPDYWQASNAAREETFDADRRLMEGGEGVGDKVKATNFVH
mmetsp:Transcript_51133/g.153637  ORF Transcript_51133/g.153637 Transcript_51133/m.153637 type:complete len:281 (-) Transcript_51133:198-1040(-)|eukprot:CAMPEP_0113529542 /NCGR_PEP_ID=MMETSP0015_2-20120614/2454_1 /TAXON_ID=2838 /ORGANISM="Odontella" /LENGTH=280 /DNA_ID=CAMNT_0000428189 /DNA_START=123 /DNA_END=965 /DNA_ORIENTATION=+ /assembly_acc=CAM_ASM_000160